MDRDYEQIYAEAEFRHPWNLARRELFSSLAGSDRSARILDVGCGTGHFLAHLERLGFENLAGFEPSTSLRHTLPSPSVEISSSLPENGFDKIFLLDVLEHIENDLEMLIDLRRRLQPNGRLLLSVPAHPFLWSRHDEVNQHFRRYTKAELRDKLTRAGFSLRRLSYWNMFFFPLICVARWLDLGGRPSDFSLGSRSILAIYGRVLRFENRLMKRVALPLGISLIAVAERSGD